MTRAQAALLRIPPPTPVILKVRHRGKLRRLTVRVGPCGLSSKRETLLGAMGDESNQIWDRVKYCIAEPNRHPYFSRYKLPKALEPWWNYWRQVETLRADLANRPDKPVSADERARALIEQLLTKGVPVKPAMGSKPAAPWVCREQRSVPCAESPSYYGPATLCTDQPLTWLSKVWKAGRPVVTDTDKRRWLVTARMGTVVIVSGPLDEPSRTWKVYLRELP